MQTVPRRSNLAMLGHQIKFEQLSFWRNPQSAGFTFVFPIVLFVIFGLVFGNGASDGFDGLTPLQYYTSTIAAFSIMGACYSQLAIGLAFRRQQGILKRLRATPLPAGTYFGGLVAHCIIVSIIEVAIIVGMSAIYGVDLPSRWAQIVLILVVGGAAFCSLGVAVASLIKNAEAAPAVVQFVFFPLVFISGTYFAINSGTLNTIADIFPVRPFNRLILSAFALDEGLDWQYLLTLLAWGVGGGIIAVWRFRWDPRPE
jgi:ABC-2 type transport system permease protein